MAIRTRSRSATGFRRAGELHTPEPQTFLEGYFSAEEIEQLETEPAIIVEHVDDEELPGPHLSAEPTGGAEPQEEPTGEKSKKKDDSKKS